MNRAALSIAALLVVMSSHTHAQVAPPSPGGLPPTPSITLTGSEVDQLLASAAESELMVKGPDGSLHPFIPAVLMKELQMVQSKVNDARHKIAEPPKPSGEKPSAP